MAFERHQVSNFGAGPAALPLSVLETAQRELLNFRGTGMSVMEISHRHAAYSELQEQTEGLFRQLLGIPSNYKVLFLQGGASLQFSMIPMNFLTEGKTASYFMTGSWSEKAFNEAKLLGEARMATTSKEAGYRHIPKVDESSWDANDAYVHLTSNNTIFGSQWQSYPHTGQVPLVADMSSDILSRPIPVQEFALIYAGAQKNLGPSGVTMVVIREDLLEANRRDIPTMLRYDVHAKNDSRYNTPPTLAVYLLGLVLQWVKDEGGLDVIASRNNAKAKLVYDAMDESHDFYRPYVDKGSRSNMNVTFRLADEELEKPFLAAAKQSGLIGLGGHRSVGGCRASLYNAVTMQDCQRLVEFMQDFQSRNS